jgi:subtilisin family serine protease
MASSLKSVLAGSLSETRLKQTASPSWIDRVFLRRHASIATEKGLHRSGLHQGDRQWQLNGQSLAPHRKTQSRKTQPAKAISSGNLKPFQRLKGELTASDGLNQRRSGAYADNYRLSGFSIGQQVRIDLKSDQFNSFLQVLNAKNGNVLWQNNDRTYNTANASVTFTIQPGVTYQIRVTSADTGRLGGYTLRSLNPSTTPLFNSDYGYGLVDAAKSVAAALNRSTFADVADLGGSQLDLDTIKAPEVWAQGFTGQGMTVAVVDTGVDYTHPDLQSNIWQNPEEIPGNGIDDDHNGYVDDVHGWNFVDTESNDPIDLEGHGTHVAGTIAATNNGFGTTGIAYGAKIMPVRVIGGMDDNYPEQFDANVAQGIRYAVQNGARVINMSLGNFIGDPTMVQTRAALEYATQSGVIAVMASGNEREQGANRPIEPANFARQGLGIAVGAINLRRQVAYFSNPAGKRPIEFLVAPGVNIRSTVPNDSYELESGTSMATPHISGVVALMLSANPQLTVAQVISILQTSANPYVVSDI